MGFRYLLRRSIAGSSSKKLWLEPHFQGEKDQLSGKVVKEKILIPPSVEMWIEIKAYRERAEKEKPDLLGTYRS